MKAVLYICHGSRSVEGQKEAIAFVERLSSSISIPIQHVCFLELCEPNIVTGVERCVHDGATTILAIPLLLLSANHAKRDIPYELEKAKEMFPSLTIIYGKPFGVQHDIISALSATIEQADAIVLVGRGSSDTEAQADFRQIAHLLQHETNVPVYPCYLAAAVPSFSDVITSLAQTTEHKRVAVVPYILFFGQLLDYIHQTLQANQASEVSFTLYPPIRTYDVLDRLVEQQVKEWG
ncbi:sirohydrochlorin ferrochelatase [Anoxybacillus tengchongensis]|uniref:Sirohydrochlorin ferrochelatase n=1 Tax=Anoxybacillus tengchongensis TaxID=576944 RepID=A0A7W9YRL6_9BACL|nr:sirohydrochlorin chelatase [Anoxybacillus tengchongensis]MBB6177039.1 sirohydrochlorin ferrochelatase [Anoxybacillus tengchongensis]